MRLLLVEDEVRLANALSRILRDNQMLVDVANDGDDGLELALTNTYDAMILDVLLPKRSGFEVLETIRSSSIQTPVLLLTALDTVENRVKGLDLGADDYLVKPFHHQELLARLRALTRRGDVLAGVASITVGPFSIELTERIASKSGIPLNLTAKEFHLLELLLRNHGKVLSKEIILDRVWGPDAQVIANAVENYVHFLRKKIDDADEPSFIETIRGVGYRFRIPSKG
jgi:DNA-binding response OmpR family regulator